MSGTFPCPLCGNHEPSSKSAYAGLRDHLFGARLTADYFWCPRCLVLYLGENPGGEELLDLYEGYYTHASAPEATLRERLVGALEADLFFARFGQAPGFRLPGGRRFLPRPIPRLARLERKYRHLGGLRPGRLLDVGCGDGRFLQDLARLGWEAEGLDFDPQAVAAARLRGVRAYQGELASLDPELRWDVITLAHVVEHVPDPLALLRTCRERLAAGGSLWLETPNVLAPSHYQFGEAWRGLEPPRHLVLFSAQALQDLLLRAGFSSVETLPAAEVGPWLAAESREIGDRILREEGRPPAPCPLPEEHRGGDDFICLRAFA